ncbi:MAG: electron transport complex subunit RsxC [Verrucomicrobiota bacterium]|nr:electron transport complex subunit RsxC [Verrucomicrobiota bacterium]
MKIFGSFKGGVHPPQHKDPTENKPIESMPLPSRVIIPLQQHTGAPCEPVVSVGQEVKEGQKIGQAKGFVSAPVHASISGAVVAIEDRPHPVLPVPARSIVIESKNAAAPAAWGTATDWSALSGKELLDRIRDAGIVGLGGAAFPTHVKLSPPRENKIDTLIVNGVECEPYLTADHRLMLERTAGVLEGVKILLKALGVSRVFIGIEKNKPDAIRTMRERAADRSFWNGAAVEVVPLNVKYPQGSEKQLIYALLRREVPSGGLPLHIGVVVQNVGTAFAVYEAVVKGRPLIERVVTVSGNRIREPKNLAVRIGAPFANVIEYAGGIVPNGSPVKVIMGGPMMGIAQYTLDVPVIKGTSGILVLEEVGQKKILPCVKCGACVDICPMNLMPNRIADFSERDNFAECDASRARDCMECGACAYACISARPLVHLIKYAKLNLSKAKKP